MPSCCRTYSPPCSPLEKYRRLSSNNSPQILRFYTPSCCAPRIPPCAISRPCTPSRVLPSHKKFASIGTGIPDVPPPKKPKKLKRKRRKRRVKKKKIGEDYYYDEDDDDDDDGGDDAGNEEVGGDDYVNTGVAAMSGQDGMGGSPEMGGAGGMGGMSGMGGMMPGMGGGYPGMESQMTGMGGMGGMRGMGGMPGMSGMPGMPGMSGMGGMSGMAGMGGLSGMQGMSGMSPGYGMPGQTQGLATSASAPPAMGQGPGQAQRPGAPGMIGGMSPMFPTVPGMTGMSGLPGMGGIAGMPGMQGMAGMPGMGGIPGMSGLPGMGGIPGMPGAPGAWPGGMFSPMGVMGPAPWAQGLATGKAARSPLDVYGLSKEDMRIIKSLPPKHVKELLKELRSRKQKGLCTCLHKLETMKNIASDSSAAFTSAVPCQTSNLSTQKKVTTIVTTTTTTTSAGEGSSDQMAPRAKSACSCYSLADQQIQKRLSSNARTQPRCTRATCQTPPAIPQSPQSPQSPRNSRRRSTREQGAAASDAGLELCTCSNYLDLAEKLEETRLRKASAQQRPLTKDTQTSYMTKIKIPVILAPGPKSSKSGKGRKKRKKVVTRSKNNKKYRCRNCRPPEDDIYMHKCCKCQL